MFIDDLKSYLEAQGYTNVYCNTLPETPDTAVGLKIQNHTVNTINDGSGTRELQIEVRDTSHQAAYHTAYELASLLDSGLEEDLIWLTEGRYVIGRLQRMPIFQTEDGTRITYDLHVALWGDNAE